MTDTLAAPVYLGSYLAPLGFALDRPDVTDIYINRPGELWIETLGGACERHDVPSLDAPLLARLARQVAALGGDVSPFVPGAVARFLDTGSRGR